MNVVTRSRPMEGRGRKVRFGGVTVTAPAPADALVAQNVELSTQALERVVERLAKPGVRLKVKKGIPLYSLDGDDPDVVIRKLDGKTQRGYVRGGEFCAID